MEKPSQFEGKNLDEVDDSEFAEIVRARNAAAPTRAVGIGGADTGAGPIHWYEHYDAKNSRPWLVIDPADGRIPPTTPEAQKRAADRAARQSRPRPGRFVRGSQPLRPVHHARASRLDDAGHLRQLVPDPSGPGLRRDPLRDDSRDAHHPARRPRRTSARRSRPTWATRAATGKATRWSSRPPISAIRTAARARSCA